MYVGRFHGLGTSKKNFCNGYRYMSEQMRLDVTRISGKNNLFCPIMLQMRHCALQVFSYSISEEKTRKEREESQQTYVIRHVLCCTGSNNVKKIYDESSHAARGMFLVQFPQAYLCWTANRILRAVHARVGPRARTPSLLSRSSVTIDECARRRHTGSVYQSDYSDYYHYDDDNVYGVRVRGWCRSGNSIFRRIIRADFMV